MKKKEMLKDIENLKSKYDYLNGSQENQGSSLNSINEKIGSLKQAVSDLQKKEAELDIASKKESALLETVKPDFIEKLKDQDISLHSLKLNVDSMKKIQETLVQELKHTKSKIEHYDYSKVSRLDRQMDDKLRKMEKLSSAVGKNSSKAEQIFDEFQKQFVEFREFRELSRKLENAFEKCSSDIEKIRQDAAKEKDMASMQKDIDALKEKLKESAKKKDIDKINKRLKNRKAHSGKKGWFF